MHDDIAERINALANREHELQQSHPGRALTDDERDQLRAVESALDQCWDLLRQRDARRRAGLDPDEATVRPAATVEGYQQ